MGEITIETTTGAPSCIGMQDRAREMARGGRDVIHLDRGELDFDTPKPVVDAAIDALLANRTRYTHSAGLPELRQAICDHYRRTYGVDVDPARVFVHAGSSPLLLALFLAIMRPGGEVLIPDPAYPAYATCVRAAGGTPIPIDTGSSAFHYHAADVASRITSATQAIVVNSPSNPTGSMLEATELADFAKLGPLIIADDAYHGLQLDGAHAHSILEFDAGAAVLNSFSKAYAMTGWRLGYLIAPPHLVGRLATLQRDSAISPNGFVQQAGITALTETGSITEGWRDQLRLRRDVLVDGLAKIGMPVSCQPRAGFYAFARLPEGYRDSAAFAIDLLDDEAVAVVAGSSFGEAGEGHVRCSFSQPVERIEQGLDRMAAFIDRRSRSGTAHR